MRKPAALVVAISLAIACGPGLQRPQIQPRKTAADVSDVTAISYHPVAGEPRSTIAIDIVAALEERHIAPLVAALSDAFYVDEQALLRAARDQSAANLIHHDTSVKIDVFVAGGTPLDSQQIARRLRVEIGGRVLFVHPPEDILLQKLRWYRKGGEVSDRQWRDILGIVRVQDARLDRDDLHHNAPVLDVTDSAGAGTARGLTC